MLMDSNNRIKVDDIIAKYLYKYEKDIKDDTKGLELVIPSFFHRNDKRFNDASFSMSKVYAEIKDKEFPIKSTLSLRGKDFEVIIYDDFHDVPKNATEKDKREILNQYSYGIEKTKGGKVTFAVYSKLF